jgi:hypothetical protein
VHAQLLDAPEREGDGEHAGPDQAQHAGDRGAAQRRRPHEHAQPVAHDLPQRCGRARRTAVECVESDQQRQRRERQGGLRQQRGLGPSGRGDTARQQRPGDQRDVEARRLERIGARQEVIAHDRRDQAREAAERQRPHQARQQRHGDREQGGHVTDAQREEHHHPAGQRLVEHHQGLPAAVQVEPAAEQRRGHEARKRDRRDEGAGQHGVAGALEREQHDRHREHLVRDTSERRGGDEAQVVRLAREAGVRRVAQSKNAYPYSPRL